MSTTPNDHGTPIVVFVDESAAAFAAPTGHEPGLTASELARRILAGECGNRFYDTYRPFWQQLATLEEGTAAAFNEVMTMVTQRARSNQPTNQSNPHVNAAETASGARTPPEARRLVGWSVGSRNVTGKGES